MREFGQTMRMSSKEIVKWLRGNGEIVLVITATIGEIITGISKKINPVLMKDCFLKSLSKTLRNCLTISVSEMDYLKSFLK
jgi:hypothetical protein|nr:MAG TPA: hypothetical protein [Caudoviricetes sp.]